MATLQKGERVFANYSKDDFNRMIAVALLRARGRSPDEKCKVTVSYNFETVGGRSKFIGARAEVLGL